MPIKLNTASGGGVTLSAANTATDKTITVPAVDGTMVLTGVSGNVDINAAGANNLTLSTNTTERARIDSSGNLLVGTTSTSKTVQGIQITGGAFADFVRTAGNDVQNFYNAGTGTMVGQIVVNASTTTYSTSSDYRLKENVAPMTGALAKVAALKPCTYTWKVDGSAGEGFIAHELAEVIPDAVTGEKDAVNEDGSIKPQGIDTSFLVATLTAAIQEQQQMIETLQAKVAALEAQ